MVETRENLKRYFDIKTFRRPVRIELNRIERERKKESAALNFYFDIIYLMVFKDCVLLGMHCFLKRFLHPLVK